MLASLRMRLVCLVLFAVLPFLLFAIYHVIGERREGIELAKENAMRLVHMAAEHHDELVESTRQLLSTLALLREVQDQDAEACNQILTNALEHHPIYSNIGVVRPDGTVFASALPLTQEVYLGDRPYFQEVTNSRGFVVGDYHVGRITKKTGLALAYPALDSNGKLRAVVYAGLDLSWLNRLATNSSLPPGSSLTVMDRNRVTLVRHPDPEGRFVGQPLQMLPRSRPSSQGLPVAVPTNLRRSSAAATGSCGFTASRGWGRTERADAGTVAVGIPLAVAYADANRDLKRAATVLVLTTAATLGLAWVGGNVFVLRRVKALVRATERLGAGDYAARTGESYGKGELHILSRAFDDMAATLQRRIAEREQAEADLRVLNEQLEQRVADRTRDLERSNRDLEQFASVASHDLQEPLRMVTNYLALLRQRYHGKLDVKADEFIDFALEGGQRMQQLIQDLLAYARVDRQGQSFAPTDCNEVMRRALANLKVALEDTGAKITFDPLPTVFGDEVQLMQLWQNLLGNAIKFRRDAPPLVEVGVRAEGDAWHFTVKDNGIGIAPHNFERIFVLFQRLHTREKYPGTGIGLAVCQKIVERHGGRIWVESDLGRGTTFHFTIPQWKNKPPEAGPGEAALLKQKAAAAV